MKRAVFFAGLGTVYSQQAGPKKQIELYPDTVSALKFLDRRGYELILLSSGYYEYKRFCTALKDKSIRLAHLNPEKNDLRTYLLNNNLDAERSFLITDGSYLQTFLKYRTQIILVLTGEGLFTLGCWADKENECFADICKNFYAAALSVALNN